MDGKRDKIEHTETVYTWEERCIRMFICKCTNRGTDGQTEGETGT